MKYQSEKEEVVREHLKAEPSTSQAHPSAYPIQHSFMEPRITFLTLPGEIREHIYRELLITDNNYLEREDQDPSTFWTFDLRIYRTSKQIHHEAREVFRRVNTFVKIVTPWESAVENTKKFSLTPVLCRGVIAEEFKGCQMTCTVDAVMMPPERGPHTFVIDARDTEGFCRSVVESV